MLFFQEPFQLFDSYYLSPQWYIPITYITSNGTTISGIWLNPTTDNVTIENAIICKSDWILVNNLQTGTDKRSYSFHLNCFQGTTELTTTKIYGTALLPHLKKTTLQFPPSTELNLQTIFSISPKLRKFLCRKYYIRCHF